MNCNVGEVTERFGVGIRKKIKLVVTTEWNKPPLSLSQKLRRGSTNAVNIIIEREGKHIFCLS